MQKKNGRDNTAKENLKNVKLVTFIRKTKNTH